MDGMASDGRQVLEFGNADIAGRNQPGDVSGVVEAAVWQLDRCP